MFLVRGLDSHGPRFPFALKPREPILWVGEVSWNRSSGVLGPRVFQEKLRSTPHRGSLERHSEQPVFRFPFFVSLSGVEKVAVLHVGNPNVRA